MRPLSFAEICLRAGGRRRYNKARQANAIARRWNLHTALVACEFQIDYNWIMDQARELGVSRSTLYRDLVALHAREAMAVRRLVRERSLERAWALGWLES